MGAKPFKTIIMDMLYLILSIAMIVIGAVMSNKYEKQGEKDNAAAFCFIIACGGIMFFFSLFNII